jgi:4-hydroxy-2-oxoheptanedioate aldolase
MRRNKLRQLLQAGQPTIGTHVHSTWPSIVEALGHTHAYDYVEFVAEYAPWDLYALDDFCRAAELHDLGTMIKVDQEPGRFQAQRAIGAGFESVLFADCRTVDDARACVRAVRADTPDAGGYHGAATRRFAYMGYGGSAQYVQALQDVVVALMIEKRTAVEQLDEILSIGGIDLVQWGPTDYSMSIGRPGELRHPEVAAAERQVFETCARLGIPARAEIGDAESARRFLDIGVRHFCLGTDIAILHRWWRQNGEALRSLIDGSG